MSSSSSFMASTWSWASGAEGEGGRKTVNSSSTDAETVVGAIVDCDAEGPATEALI